MRTTVDIDEDILRVVKHLSEERGQSQGRVLSDLARIALRPADAKATTSGIPVLSRKAGAKPVTMQIVKELLEQDPV